MVKVQCKMKTDLIIDHGDYHVGWVGFGLVLCFGVCFLFGGAGGGLFFFLLVFKFTLYLFTILYNDRVQHFWLTVAL